MKPLIYEKSALFSSYIFHSISNILFLASFLLATSSTLSASPLAVRMDIRTTQGALIAVSSNLHHPTWLKKNKAATLIYSSREKREEWKTHSFTFSPLQSGEITLLLRGPYTAGAASQWVLFRNIRKNGRPFTGDVQSQEFVKWKKNCTSHDIDAVAVDDPALTPSGPSMRVTHDGYLSRTFSVKAGEPITIEVDACPTFAFTPSKGMYPLSLNKFANRDYADEAAGDKKGGWSDQGAEKDLRKFDTSRKQFGGIQFNLIDPERNNRKAVVVFDSPFAPTGLREIVLEVPESQKGARFLHLLHTGCWVSSGSGVTGTLIFEDGNGKKTERKVLDNKDILDWTAPVFAENAIPVSVGNYSGQQRAVYLSTFPLPVNGTKRIHLKTTGKIVWILCGVTLSNHEVTVENVPFIPKAPEYKTADLAPLAFTGSGSALDFSPLLDSAPAGSYGRVRLAEGGRLEFEKRPGVPLRFRAAYHFAMPWDSQNRIRKKSTPELRKMIDEYVTELRRRGYNMVRTHTLERLLMLDAQEKGRPDPRFADAVDYCFAQLKKNGIYLNLNIAAYQLLYPYPKEIPQDHKTKFMFGDKETRREWLNTARYLLCHVNPHTGLALKDDPMLICVEPYNELEYGYMKNKWRKKETSTWILRKFREYLLHRNGKAGETRIPRTALELESGEMRQEWLEFCIESQREAGAWMNARLQELGCKSFVGQYNLNGIRYYNDIRSEQSDIVFRNTYFCHPSKISRLGAITRQRSAIESFVSYFTDVASCRLSDRPLIITEYNHARNRYEYEQLLFPAYAALQGFSGLTMHEVDMRPEWRAYDDFSTYLDRMTDYLSFFLFQKGYVKPSPNLVELVIPKSSLYGSDTDNAINTEQARWSLFTRFAVRYENTGRPAMVAAFAPPEPLLRMPLIGYSEVMSAAQFSETGAIQGEKFDPAPLIAALRKKGVIPQGNRTDPAKGIWESDTGELLLNGPRKRFLLKAPRVEATSFEANHDIPLPVLNRVRSSVPSTVALISLDGKELAKDSKRMLLFYLTDNVNTGMELSPDRSILRRPGKAPTLLRTGQLELQLNLPAGKRYLLYPLRSDGLRREGIPLTKNGSGYRLELNTAALPHGPTGVFELVTEP